MKAWRTTAEIELGSREHELGHPLLKIMDTDAFADVIRIYLKHERNRAAGPRNWSRDAVSVFLTLVPSTIRKQTL